MQDANSVPVPGGIQLEDCVSYARSQMSSMKIGSSSTRVTMWLLSIAMALRQVQAQPNNTIWTNGDATSWTLACALLMTVLFTLAVMKIACNWLGTNGDSDIDGKKAEEEAEDGHMMWDRVDVNCGMRQ